jgi:hypothetical protein
MDWVYLALVCAHLLIGLFCGHLAYEARHRAEPWFLAGIVLGGLALIVCFYLANRKRPSIPPRLAAARRA